MSDPAKPPAGPDLQFDRAVSPDAPQTEGVACSKCGRAIAQSYFNLEQRPYCGPCKVGIERGQSDTLTAASFVKALVFGLGAAVAGAAIYYAVIAITNLEIGIVAILIGYMVGYAVRAATRGGARRYQVMAGALTYFSVALAYLPLAIQAGKEGKASAKAQHVADSTRLAIRDSASTATDVAAAESAAADSTAPVTQAGAPTAAKPTPVRQVSFVKAAGTVLFLVLALPVMMVFGSLPTGLISGLIIGFGMRRAWRMTAGQPLIFDGPLRVARPAAADPQAPGAPA